MCKIKKIARVATQNEVEGMSTEQLQETLLRVVELQPGVSMDIFKPAEQQPGGYHPALGGSAPDWCMCGRCREMPTDIETRGPRGPWVAHLSKMSKANFSLCNLM